MRPQQKIKFMKPRDTLIGKIFSFFIRNYQIGYFHQLGFSGNQKNNEKDILIIEQENGRLICIPNNTRYYKYIS